MSIEVVKIKAGTAGDDGNVIQDSG